MSVNNSWLGRWFLIKTFDNVDDCDVEEIRSLLDDAENEIVNGMDKSDRKYALIGYPEISQKSFERIQSVRSANDPQFSMVLPHFTLVFPFSEKELSQGKLIEHVVARLRGVRPISFMIEKAVVARNNSDFQVHLVLGKGASEVTALHDLLYSGVLAHLLRVDIPYVPHITVASASGREPIQRLVDSINREDMYDEGVIAKVTLGLLDGKKVNDVQTFNLQSD